MTVIFPHWPTLYSKLIEIRERRFTGILTFTCHGSTKNVTFSCGCPVGTSSTLLDDRLGEVMYRRGALNLDNFLNASSKVTKTSRFGEILVESGLLSPIDLWHFLNVQSREVILSLMSAETTDVQETQQDHFRGRPLPVGFDGEYFWESLRDMSYLLSSFESYSQKTQSFHINPLAKEYMHLSDYQLEFCQLIQINPTYGGLVHDGSRLKPFYTLRTLCEAFCMGLIQSHSAEENSSWFAPTPQICQFAEAFEYGIQLITKLQRDKETYLKIGNRWLARILGPGCYVTPTGFHKDTIMAQWKLLKAESEFHFSSQAFSTPSEEKLYKHMSLLLLFLAFELTNAHSSDESLKPLHKAVEALSPATIHFL